MRKLLTTLATAATAALGFAEITAREDFEDSSYRAAYGNDDNKPSLKAPYDFDGYGDYYRSLDDDVDEELSADNASCVDAVMQFKYADVPDEFDGAEKLVVFANSDGKLVVVDADATNVTTTAIAEDVWYRLTIVSVDETVNDATIKKFKVYVNGVLAETEGGADSFKSRKADSNSVATMTLSGTGKVDNFVARTTNPFGGAPAGWVAKVGDDPEQHFTDYTDALKAALAGATLTFADPTVQMDGTPDHPFKIRSAADLQALANAVNAGNTCSGKCFVQTANIDMSEAGAFAGIGVYAKVPTAGKPFTGTYNGQNHKIMNVTRAAGDTQGVFNQVGVGGVVENLVVSNMTFDSSLTGEYGCAIVGNAGGGATLRNLTAEGVFGSAEKPSTHNMAGIVVRLSPGATAGAATTIDSCTNNATIYGGYTKLGGICAIVQNQTGFVDGKVVFVNCANNGTLVCKRKATGVTGNGGILGYIAGTNVELENCYGNGVITNSDGANTDKDGALVGWTYGGTIKDNGGNSAPSDKKMIGTWGSATETGFQYATVANDVATTVTLLSAGNTYLLEGSVAASETPVFTFAEAGTIAFDAALGYNFEGTVTAAEGLLVLASEPVGTVKTYTAAPIVAKIGDTPYASLADAVAAAESDATVKLVADVTLAARVEPTKSMTIDLGGYTVTPTAVCDNGSAFDVKSGTVTIKNGAIDGSAITETECDPITARSGSDVTLEGLTITICSQNGACAYPFIGAKMTIKSGTYKNTTVTPYQYKQGWTGMAVNQGNTAMQLLFIEGGSFAQVNPALGDDSWAEGAGTFLAKGYVSTYDDVNGVWVVSEQKGFPGGAEGKTFNIDTAVQTALEAKLPEGKALTNAVAGVTSGMTYAQAYALGLLDEDTGAVAKDVTPTIEIKDGKVVVSLDTAAKDAYKVTLTVYESTSLGANATWSFKASYELDSETEAEGFEPADGGSGFYKVGVVIEDNQIN